MASSERVWVSVAISPSSISFLITSGAPRPRDSATSLTVAPDWISVAGSSCCAAASRAAASASRSGSTQRGRHVRLVDARGRRLHVEAGLLKDGEDLLAGDPLLLRYFVDALLCHSLIKSMRWGSTVTGARKARRSA